MFKSPMWDIKEPTHYSKRVGCEVPGVVAVLCVIPSGWSGKNAQHISIVLLEA